MPLKLLVNEKGFAKIEIGLKRKKTTIKENLKAKDANLEMEKKKEE